MVSFVIKSEYPIEDLFGERTLVSFKKLRLKFNIPNSNCFPFCFSQLRDIVWLNL